MRLSILAGLALTAATVAGVSGSAMAMGALPTGEFQLAAADAAAGEFLVTFRDSVRPGDVRRFAGELSRAHGGKQRHVFQAVNPGFSVSMSEKEARKLARDRRIESVVQDSYLRPAQAQNNAPGHLDRIDERAQPLDGKYNVSYSPYSKPGHGRTVYVLDSGVNLNHTTFGGRASAGPDFANKVGEQGYGSGTDCYGHGTGVAALAVGETYGVARGAKVVSLKVTRGCQGNATNGALRAAVEWVRWYGAPGSVANISFAGPVSPGAIVTENAIKSAVAAGKTIVVGAGNNGQDACLTSPARVPVAITVAATNVKDQRWSGSNWGSCVDVYAVGENVTTASRLSNTATLTASGTSFAAPQVAGATAELLKRHPVSSSSVPRVKYEATYGVISGEPKNSANYLLHFGGLYTTSANIKLPDVGGVGSVITVSGQTDPGSAMHTHLKVNASIGHPTRGQLNVDLFAPDGRSWRLHSPSSDTGNNVFISDFPIHAGHVSPNGKWTLRIDDKKKGGSGVLNGWSIQF